MNFHLVQFFFELFKNCSILILHIDITYQNYILILHIKITYQKQIDITYNF
jgi:hypothetical protein